MKIVTILGARPQFIKASVVSNALTKFTGYQEVLVHTGQHFDYDMSDVFFAQLGLPLPNYNLGIHGGHHGEMTGRMLIELEQVLLAEKPDAVLVYGDTNSTLAGALAAAKLHIPIAHVESGLRSRNMAMPEEVNRVVTDRLSTWLFTPTMEADRNLLQEGVDNNKIFRAGDVMYDAALYFGAKVGPEGGMLEQLKLEANRYVLATIHRAENTDSPSRMEAIVSGLIAVSREIPVVWPLHPRTRNILTSLGLLEKLLTSVHVISPVGYLDMLQLEKYASVVATDSGGVQKEAFFYRVPCVTVREETEWNELVVAGWNRLAPPQDGDGFAATVIATIGCSGESVEPYGDGHSSQAIANRLAADLIS